MRFPWGMYLESMQMIIKRKSVRLGAHALSQRGILFVLFTLFLLLHGSRFENGYEVTPPQFHGGDEQTLVG